MEQNNYKFKSRMFYLSMLPLFISLLILKFNLDEIVNAKELVIKLTKNNDIKKIFTIQNIKKIFTVNNCIVILSIFYILMSLPGFLGFRNITYNDKDNILKIKTSISINYESLSFLATYIIPLVCFELNSYRELFVFFILIKILVKVYIESNLYYTNPILILFNYYIFEIESTKGSDYILIIKGKAKKDDTISYIKLGENIIYGRLL